MPGACTRSPRRPIHTGTPWVVPLPNGRWRLYYVGTSSKGRTVAIGAAEAEALITARWARVPVSASGLCVDERDSAGETSLIHGAWPAACKCSLGRPLLPTGTRRSQESHRLLSPSPPSAERVTSRSCLLGPIRSRPLRPRTRQPLACSACTTGMLVRACRLGPPATPQPMRPGLQARGAACRHSFRTPLSSRSPRLKPT